jgi:hypothetical protein
VKIDKHILASNMNNFVRLKISNFSYAKEFIASVLIFYFKSGSQISNYFGNDNTFYKNGINIKLIILRINKNSISITAFVTPNAKYKLAYAI